MSRRLSVPDLDVDLWSIIFDHLPLKDRQSLRLCRNLCWYHLITHLCVSKSYVDRIESILENEELQFSRVDSILIEHLVRSDSPIFLFMRNMRLKSFTLKYANSDIYVNNRIGPEGANVLAQAFKVNCSLTSLNLPVNGIGPEGANAIAEALKVNGSLTSLDISNNLMGDEGVKPICEALKQNTTLRVFDLNARNVSGGEIGPQGAKYLADMLGVNGSLTSLSTAYNSISGDGAQQLASAVLAKPVMENFSGIPLKELRTDLNLFAYGVGVPGAMVLADLLRVTGSLTSLNLNYNNLNSEGGKVIAEALKVNDSLRYLGLGCNNIKSEGGIAMAEALKVNNSLMFLAVYRNKIDAYAIQLLRDAVREREGWIELESSPQICGGI